jgi:hypothetical protein
MVTFSIKFIEYELKAPSTNPERRQGTMMKPNTTFMIKAIAMSWLLILTACGGGGGTAAGAVAGPQGLWDGNTSTSRSVKGIVLEDGTFWLLYSVPNFSALMAGFVQGTDTSLDGSFSSLDAIDFNFSGQGINNAVVSASYITKQSFNGSVSYPKQNAPLTFTSSYNADYDQLPSLTGVAGNYLGLVSVASSNEAVTLLISAQGVVAGTGATTGCQYGGLIGPRKKGNLYDVSLAISGGACATGTNAVTGIGYFDASSKSLYLAAINKSRTLGMGFTGIKP